MLFIEIITNVLTILGVYLVGRKMVIGWVMQTLGQFGWIYLFIEKDVYSALPTALVLLGLIVYNIWKWNSDNTSNTPVQNIERNNSKGVARTMKRIKDVKKWVKEL